MLSTVWSPETDSLFNLLKVADIHVICKHTVPHTIDILQSVASDPSAVILRSI